MDAIFSDNSLSKKQGSTDSLSGSQIMMDNLGRK